jgi:hypothetical protein
LQACWDCFIGGVTKCPIGGIQLIEKSANDKSGSTRSGPPATKKSPAQPNPAKSRREIKVSPDEDDDNPDERSNGRSDDGEGLESGSEDAKRSDDGSDDGEGTDGGSDDGKGSEGQPRKRKRASPPEYSPYTPTPGKRFQTATPAERSSAVTEQRHIKSPVIVAPPPNPVNPAERSSAVTEQRHIKSPVILAPPPKPVNIAQSWLDARQRRVVTAPGAVVSTNTESRSKPGFGGLTIAPAGIQQAKVCPQLS